CWLGLGLGDRLGLGAWLGLGDSLGLGWGGVIGLGSSSPRTATIAEAVFGDTFGRREGSWEAIPASRSLTSAPEAMAAARTARRSPASPMRTSEDDPACMCATRSSKDEYASRRCAAASADPDSEVEGVARNSPGPLKSPMRMTTAATAPSNRSYR